MLVANQVVYFEKNCENDREVNILRLQIILDKLRIL